MTLRNFGPSGAGRTLVLLDGIPVNDPSPLRCYESGPAGVDRIVLVNQGGGAGVIRDAPAGTIFLVSKPMETTAGSAEDRSSTPRLMSIIR